MRFCGAQFGSESGAPPAAWKSSSVWEIGNGKKINSDFVEITGTAPKTKNPHGHIQIAIRV